MAVLAVAERPWAAVATGFTITVVLVAGIASVLGVRASRPVHPSAWDPRVADLAAFVEQRRDGGRGDLISRHSHTYACAERVE